MLRSCNMRIRLARQGGVYTASVVWARRGRSGMTIQDTSGKWDRMPERIEEAVYGGLTQADQDALEHAVPEVFANAADAMRWGMDQGVFKDEAHAQNTYELVKRAKKPATAARMRDLWVAEVQARQAGGSTLSEAERQEANGQQEAS